MDDHVIWPEKYHPKVSSIYALNDIDVKASAEVVWKILVDVTNWAKHFPPENQVSFLNGATELALGTKIRRVTVGFPMTNTVTEFVPGRRLAWIAMIDGDETESGAYHGWVITPTETGCHLLTEETQQGEFWIELIGKKDPGGLYRYHQQWVEGLAQEAEAVAAKP